MEVDIEPIRDPCRAEAAGRDDVGDAEVLVIGAGPAGCATAIILARHGLSVCLASDGRTVSWPGETLPPGSTDVIADVFGEGALRGHDRAFAVQAAWETADLQVTDALGHALEEGWLLDRRAFNAYVRTAAVDAGVTLRQGHAHVSRGADGLWSARVGGITCRAPKLVDATGRSAAIALRAGARRQGLSRLLACIAICPERGDCAQATTVESVSDGWWYSTPTPDGGRVLALVSDVDLVPRGTARRHWWLASLRATRYIRELVPEGWPGSSDLAQSMQVSQAGPGWLIEPRGPGWIAVGDAAVHFDPLSSQGLLTGILMGARAGQAMVDDSLAEWEIDYRMLREEHMALASYYYGLVERWPQSPFWARRSPKR